MKRLLLAVLILMLISEVYGHPGRTNSEGCHTCKTNCEQYGLQYGEYHCHNKTSSNGTINNSNDSTTSSGTTSSTKTSISTTSKKITTSIKKQEVKITTTVLEELTGSAIKEGDIKLVSTIENIEKDIYPKTSINQIAYESSDYKARRAALYMFSFILILVLIKFIIRK